MSDIYCEKIYFLGPEGSYCQNAMQKFIDICSIKAQEQVPLKTIKSALEAIDNDAQSVCVVPIENSIEGIVRETIDNLLNIKNKEIKIQGETSIPISHLLLSKSREISNIKKIISHPQALAQCSNYLYKNFKNAEIKEVSSTSYAAQKVSLSEDISIAAIANETSAKLFNLNILSEEINDEKGNTTRFFILSAQNFDKAKSGKTSLILSTKNQPGALCEVLKIFHKNNINLTYIDSRPSKKRLGEYLFFIETDGYKNDDKNKAALEEVTQYTDFLKVLGSYQIFA